MISCVYCGGEHPNPAAIKQCWADQGAQEAPVPGGGNATAAGDSPSAGSAGGQTRSDSYSTLLADWGITERGPIELGRNVVVEAGDEPPDAWAGVEQVVIDAAAFEHPEPLVQRLRAAMHQTEPVVFVLTIPRFGRADAPAEVEKRPTYRAGATHTFMLDELHHLVWSNSVDGRGSDKEAASCVVPGGASIAPADVAADLILSDGTPVWVDGGPVRFVAPIDGVGVVPLVQMCHGRVALPGSNITGAELAPDQLAAVTHPGTTARIIAPAGSGKTRVLTERARHLVTDWNLPAGCISVVAFNKRAQEEIAERTADIPGLAIRTLNSIALAIINGRPPFERQPQRWQTITEPDVRTILGRFVKHPKKLNVDPIAPWIDAMSVVRLGLVEPAEVEARFDGDVDGLTEIYPSFRRALLEAGAVDFDQQVAQAIELLLRSPSARRVAQRACRVLLVDEFQDLTPAHVLLVRLLAGPGGSVFGVGDDDQTIYGYNGADPKWLIEFERWFPGAGDHPLEVNYRCPGGVVEAADRLLRHNGRRVAKTIRAASPGTGGWSASSTDNPVGATVDAVVASIEGGAAPADVAVLTRVNAVIAPVQAGLVQAGVPVAGGVGIEFVERTAVRATLAWLRIAAGGSLSERDQQEALRRPSRGLHPKVRDWVAEQTDVAGLLRLAGRLNNEKDATKVSDFAADVDRLRTMAASGATTEHLITSLFDDVGLGGAVATLDHGRAGMNRSAQGDDLLAMRQLAKLHPDVSTFATTLNQWLSSPKSPVGVTLATVHRVKGLEWPHVVVHLADTDQYPHRLSEDVEEERRLFHVALTRASAHATIVSGPYPSDFVAELTAEPPAVVAAAPISPKAKTSSRVARQPGQRSADGRDHPLLDRTSVYAVVGLILVDGGQEWPIVSLEPEAAVTERNGVIRKFALGAKVETLGRQRGKLGPRPGDVDEGSARMYDLLRSYRDKVRAGKPAYTVFDDKTVAAIATRLPDDLGALSQVKGVGPAKLEQYGDDVLDLAALATNVH